MERRDIAFVEEATMVRIPEVVPSISEVSATGGSLSLEGGDEDVASSGKLSAQLRSR